MYEVWGNRIGGFYFVDLRQFSHNALPRLAVFEHAGNGLLKVCWHLLDGVSCRFLLIPISRRMLYHRRG